jgi:NADH:quinone reductase (non-electrogenic)
LQKHVQLVHSATPIQLKRILILGGGFGGIEVLRQLQKAFQDHVDVHITVVSRDNFFLFPPMLPEVSSGMIETRHILTPVRTFCKRAKFYEANVESLDLKNRDVVIAHAIGNQTRNHILKYDYLVLALGDKTNFYGMTEVVANNALTMKSIGDAILLRNHVISMLEQADIEHEDLELRRSLMTFVIVGGGFSGVEAAGELNDFVRVSIENFYHNLDRKDARVILVNSGNRILPEVTWDLAQFALQQLRKKGVEVMLNTRLTGATQDSVKLNNGSLISSNTLIWAGGALPDRLIGNLSCDHDKSGRIVVNKSLEINGYENNAFVVGDCACITGPHTGTPHPPTAQHALRQARVATKNIIFAINGKSDDKKISFDYKTKGMMALIGKRNGVGILLRHKVHGFTAWFLWRLYYLGNLPTVEKKLRVALDWTIDLFFKRDVSKLRTFTEESSVKASTQILR